MTTATSPEQMPEPEELPGCVPWSDHRPNEMVAGDDWVPGEPLYSSHSGGYVRQLFQLMPDNEHGGYYWDDYWCHACDVLWPCWVNDKADAPCWYCGAATASPHDEKENAYRYEQLKGKYR